jgi:hypothetical protein
MEPKSFKARFIEPGIISYDDQKQGTVFVSKEALDRMAPSFRGCPVIFVPENHNDSSKANAFDFDNPESGKAQGVVSGVPYWGDDGFQWVEMIVWDDDAVKAIENGYSVSCSYNVDDVGPRGQWHQIPYDEEITAGHYLHMAIVPNPRYESSKIIANSKGGSPVALFKTKKNTAPAQAPAPAPEPVEENAVQMDNEATVDVNGTPVPLYELIEAFMMQKGANEPASTLSPEDEVQLPDGSTVKVSELIAAYSAGSEMENAEAPQDTKGEPAVDQTKQNAAPARPAISAPTKTVNASLKNAATKGGADFDPRGDFESQSARLKRGEERYRRSNPAVPQGGK